MSSAYLVELSPATLPAIASLVATSDGQLLLALAVVVAALTTGVLVQIAVARRVTWTRPRLRLVVHAPKTEQRAA
jgi:hypothetical protein